MKRTLIVGLFGILMSHANGQDSFYDFVDSVYNIQDSLARNAYVLELISHLDTAGTPLIEGDTANFIYHGTAETIEIAGDFNGWGGNGTWMCERVPKTPFYFYSATFEPDARLDYKFIKNGSTWLLDPLNPNTVTGGYGPNSELAMPDYVQPWEIEQYSGVEHGSLENFSLHSPELNKNFSIQVLLPPGYDPDNKSYPVVYVHDGHEYLSLGSMDHVIENLLDSNKIDPVIGVFIRPNDRMEEYGFSQRFEYAQFIVETVVPYIDGNYSTIRSKDYRLTMGCSLGGNISGLISYSYPEVFGNSGWHSPALWVNEGEVASMFTSELREVKIYFDMGTYEDLGVDWEAFTGSLTGLGYTYSRDIYHEGHSWGLWRATIDNILEYFFPAGAAPLEVEEMRTVNLIVGKAYPNPTNGMSSIPIRISQPGTYCLEINNQLGQSVLTEEYTFDSAGEYLLEINSSHLSGGMFHFRIASRDESFSGKMLVY